MLKLEKSRKDGEIHIRLRQPVRLCDRYFLFALAAAISVHLLGALLFHIRLFSLGESESILPPTKAYAHFIKGSPEESDAVVTAQVNMEGRLTPAQLAPPESFPSLQPLAPPYLAHSVDYPVNLENNPFIEIEKDIEENYFALLDIPVIAPSVKIAITGPLAEIPLQAFNDEFSRLFDLHKFSAQNLRQECLVYSVQVDSKSGQIFWFQAQEPSHNNVQTAMAEKLLKNIIFQTNRRDFVQNGQVEITFTSRGDA